LRLARFAPTRPLDRTRPWFRPADRAAQVGATEVLVILGGALARAPVGERPPARTGLHLAALVPAGHSGRAAAGAERERAVGGPAGLGPVRRPGPGDPDPTGPGAVHEPGRPAPLRPPGPSAPGRRGRRPGRRAGTSGRYVAGAEVLASSVGKLKRVARQHGDSGPTGEADIVAGLEATPQTKFDH
jgi:hypothetical protein